MQPAHQIYGRLGSALMCIYCFQSAMLSFFFTHLIYLQHDTDDFSACFLLFFSP